MDYDKLIAPAAREMRPSGIRKFFDLAADMPECISLGVGEPDFKTPWAVREAGMLCAFTTENRWARQGDDVTSLPRVRISGEYALDSFIALVNG